MPVRLAADPLLQGYDGRVQRRVGARGDPQLERGGEHRAGEVVGEHLQHGAGAPLAASAGAAAASRSSSPRSSLRCSTAATTRSFLVGKWCSWAPRLTPARWETSVVDVPLQPCSTRHSTVASSRRWRMARVRSSCGTRTGETLALVTRAS